jgi:hypothetical protein
VKYHAGFRVVESEALDLEDHDVVVARDDLVMRRPGYEQLLSTTMGSVLKIRLSNSPLRAMPTAFLVEWL